MRDHPDTAHLLATARRALLEQVVLGLEGEAQGTALMLARVFAVLAARHAADARARAAIESGAETEELAALAGLLGESAPATRLAHGGTDTAIASLSRRLVGAIRRGSFDPPGREHDALLRFLLQITRAKVAENNPKVLESIGRGPEEET
ncbi:MAG: DUF6285 domain-containing protein [SAR324 cluster bacterium]